MQTTAGRIETAERFSRRRARLLPFLGIALIVVDAIAPDGIGWLARAAWLAVFAAGFVIVVTGGTWPGSLRALIDDEVTSAHRKQAVFVGYCAAIACAAGLYVVSAFHAISASQSVQIVLSTAIAAPLISFGTMERRALGDA